MYRSRLLAVFPDDQNFDEEIMKQSLALSKHDENARGGGGVNEFNNDFLRF